MLGFPAGFKASAAMAGHPSLMAVEKSAAPRFRTMLREAAESTIVDVDWTITDEGAGADRHDVSHCAALR